MQPNVHAPACRALAARVAARGPSGTLSTIARDPAGFPFGSLVALAFDDEGRPLLLLSSLAEHTGNLLARPEASVMVADPDADPASAVTAARMTIVGRVRRLDGEEADAARARYLGAHPAAAQFASFADFAMYVLDPLSVRYVGGFGRMSWVDGDAYRAAAPPR